MSATVVSTCPSCPLLCDDGVDCVISRQAKQDISALPRIGSRIEGISPQQVIDWFGKNETVTIEANGIDMAAAKEVLAIDAELTTYRTSTQKAIALATTRDGVIRGTLGDVRRHADLIYMIGSVEAQTPRFLDRVLHESASPELISMPDGILARDIPKLFDDLSFESKYTAIVLGPDAFTPSEADLAAVMIVRKLRQHNEESRSALVTMDSAATIDSVSLWTRGFSVASTTDDHVDIKIQGSLASPSPTKARLQIGGSDGGLATCEAFLPIATPGFDAMGIAVRGDSTVTLSLVAPQTTDRMSLTTALHQLVG